MDIDRTYQELTKIVPKERIKTNESMKKHTSFKIGGPADLFVTANKKEEIQDVLKLVKEKSIPLTIIGNGTNILVKDNGIRGIVLKPDIKGIFFDGEKVTAGAGELLIKLSIESLKNELTGMEFANGIPGTVGGAIKMNAGAFGQEMKDVVYETTYMDREGKIYTINNKEHEFDYRHSVFSENDNIIIETKIVLEKGNKNEIENKMNENKQSRMEKQPTSMPSAGSTFKRGEGFITAKLIDECGLKGIGVGGAEVSKKHAGFIVNNGNATAKDVLSLVKLVKNKVKEKFDVDINLEIQIMGE